MERGPRQAIKFPASTGDKLHRTRGGGQGWTRRGPIGCHGVGRGGSETRLSHYPRRIVRRTDYVWSPVIFRDIFLTKLGTGGAMCPNLKISINPRSTCSYDITFFEL